MARPDRVHSINVGRRALVGIGASGSEARRSCVYRYFYLTDATPDGASAWLSRSGCKFKSLSASYQSRIASKVPKCLKIS